jgi:TRAP-type C4-dicarboxylate transport system permease small subunit
MARLDGTVSWLLDTICIVLTAGLFVVITIVVATRIGGLGSPAWSDEIVELMLAWLIFLGAAALWRRGEHFRVDLLEQTIQSVRMRLRLAILVELLCIGFLAVLTYYGSTFAILATDTSPTFALPRVFWFAAMPVSSGLMLIYSVRRLWRLLRGIEAPGGPAPDTGCK